MFWKNLRLKAFYFVLNRRLAFFKLTHKRAAFDDEYEAIKNALALEWNAESW